jgi:magnesium-transporting ATPase (P-type)
LKLENSSFSKNNYLLVSSASFRLVLSNNSLLSHFLFVLQFFHIILGHDFQSMDKANFVVVIKKIKNYTILVVGDGANDKKAM